MLRIPKEIRLPMANSGWRDMWPRLLERPDALMLELGAGGELLVSQMRAVLSLLLLPLPLINVLGGGKLEESMIGLFGAVFAIVMSQVWLALARQRGRYRWLPWVTATYDVSMTTLVLGLLAWSSPVIGLNSMVVWAFYLIAICMTALRNDGRLTLYTGLLALLEYALLSLGIFSLVDSPDQLVSIDYGTATPGNQIQRLVLLAMVTGIAATIVYRMQTTGGPVRHRRTDRPAQPDLAGASVPDHARRHPRPGWLAVDLPGQPGPLQAHQRRDRPPGRRPRLRHAVDMLREQLEEGDFLARLGGEEFALLMPLPIGRAWERLDSMRRTSASQPFLADPGADPVRVTFSAGIAVWPHDGTDLSQLLRRADVRLRQAKLEGRNRVLARDA